MHRAFISCLRYASASMLMHSRKPAIGLDAHVQDPEEQSWVRRVPSVAISQNWTASQGAGAASPRAASMASVPPVALAATAGPFTDRGLLECEGNFLVTTINPLVAMLVVADWTRRRSGGALFALIPLPAPSAELANAGVPAGSNRGAGLGNCNALAVPRYDSERTRPAL